MTKHVLVVDDDPCFCAVLDAELTKREWRTTLAQSPSEALAVLASVDDDVDVILTDFQMQETSGAELCARVVEMGRFIPVIVMTSFGSMDTAVAAIRAGAYDYVTKPLDLDDLTLTIERGIKERALRAEVQGLRLGLEDPAPFGDLVGACPEMATAYALIERLATSDATVLITGESGTGKELVAKAIHARSPRSGGPFIAVNCAAMPETLLESELFGHAKGAFTDARQARRGLFLKASGGTLFLDEIGEMPVGMQTKLLRALQERTVRAVGDDAETPFDTRILAATNRDLEHEVAERRFRADLFYRINVVNIEVPPLRVRGRDILALAKHMLLRAQPNERRIVGFTVAAAAVLLAHSWPGNVRELQNVIERAVALAEFDHVRVEDLPDSVTQPKSALSDVAGHDPTHLITAAELQGRYVAQVMAVAKGNKTLAARILGCDRRTVARYVREGSPPVRSPLPS